MDTIVSYICVTGIGFSTEFFNFRRRHLAVSSKQIGRHSSTTANNFELNVLHKFSNNVEIEPTSDGDPLLMSTAMAVIDLIIDKSKSNMLSLSTDTTNAEFKNQFPGHGIVIEGLITDSSGKVFPQKVTLTSTVRDESMVMYLYPPSFKESYPNSNVVVIPIVSDPMQMTIMPYDSMMDLVSNLKTLPFEDEFNDITEDIPCTSQEIVSHKWVSSSGKSIDLPFGLVCYGYPSEEQKLNAVRSALQSNDNVPRSALELSFPKLFGSVGLTLYPFWNSIAIDGIKDVYSPVVNIQEMISKVEDISSDIDPNHVSNIWEVIPTTYQSISILSILDESAVGSTSKFSEGMSDYFLAGPSSPEFVNMSPDTREFVKLLYSALLLAETYPNSEPSQGVDIDIVNGDVYAVFYSSGLRWRVMSKVSFTKHQL